MESKFIFRIFTLCFLISCGFQDENENCFHQIDSKLFHPSDSMFFDVDSLSTPNLRNIEILKDNDLEILSYKVFGRNRFNQYSLNSFNFVGAIEFDYVDKYGVGELHACAHLSKEKLICLNDVGELKKIYYKDSIVGMQTFSSFDVKKYSRLFFDPQLLPIINVSEDKFMIPNYFPGWYNEDLISVVDFKENTIESVVLVPNDYIDGYFGFGRFGFWNYVNFTEKSQLHFNFPNLDDIFIYNYEGEFLYKKEVSSTFKCKNIDRLFQEKTPEEAMLNGVTSHDLDIKAKSKFIYEGLLYIPDLDKFCRIVGHPIPNKMVDLNDPIKSEVREYSIIVTDSSYNIVNEYILPYNYYEMSLKSYFIYDNHLCIQRKMKSEDIIVVDKYSLE